LTDLLRKDTPYIWNDKTERAFITLKTLLTTEPLLQYTEFTRTFVSTTGASNDAIGALLSQVPIRKDVSIAFVSRNLNNAERNYPTLEKELLAIVWGCKNFKQYLYGRTFTAVTEHRPYPYLTLRTRVLDF
jgi:hypothetical protein